MRLGGIGMARGGFVDDGLPPPGDVTSPEEGKMGSSFLPEAPQNQSDISALPSQLNIYTYHRASCSSP